MQDLSRFGASNPPSPGPGTGTAYVEATRSAGQWTFDKLVVEIDDTEHRIDLLEDASP